MPLIFVDCEAYGGAPCVGRLTEFGAVEFKSRSPFRGLIERTKPDPDNPAVPLPSGMSDEVYREHSVLVFGQFAAWLAALGRSRHIMVSDNPAYDFQWINDGFLRHGMLNPFGHSARRISDFYAGLRGNFYETQGWKRLRVTAHDHDPVNDAMGNVEAFERMLKGER